MVCQVDGKDVASSHWLDTTLPPFMLGIGYLRSGIKYNDVLQISEACLWHTLKGFKEVEGRFTLWPSKSRAHGIEWPNFVESPMKWVENSHQHIGIGASGRA
jgi:hypothetical protein